MASFHTLSIAEIKQETPSAVSITFEIPDHLKSDFQFTAGQYLTLKTNLEGEEVRRDYSICTNPANGPLKVVVKKVENGLFSVYASEVLKEGDTLDVAPPNGRFTFEPDAKKERTVVAFAAGSGITPIMGILLTLLEEEPKSKALLVYGNSSEEETIFLKELQDLKQKYTERFELQSVYSKRPEDGALFGRIEKPVLNLCFNRYTQMADAESFYLCGPEAMMNTIKAVLSEKGVSSEAIKYELFTPSTEASETIDLKPGHTAVTVLVDDEESSFVMENTKTILEVALKNNIDAPYSCQGGVCSSCIAKLIEGEVHMRQNNILTDSEIEEGLILTCQAQPTTSVVKVDYDDV